MSPRSQLRDANKNITNLLTDLDNKNHEIVSLNKKIMDIEKTKNEMVLEMKKYEDDIEDLENKYNQRENNLLNRINHLELEVSY